MKRVKIRLALRHETFLTERENGVFICSTNQTSLWDANLNKYVPGGRLVGRRNEYK